LEDQQTLALYIAVQYPNIKDAKANSIVAAIVTERTRKPRGFDMNDIARWTKALEEAKRATDGPHSWVTTFIPFVG
jgi:hypothetical protein